ncbi:hypothetical protein LGK95_00295 [Clostridium algoriphilum]|uniref:hypothetical protein n=1 Tax=Clostridium algoriphilum TaxID=198347 RepID=UPI001CF26C35|nr:hypothetical protein [Clostridium algoriphilum]MCB2291977.1 hypothetical protein [Clostridium algoriphilum]
MQTKKGFILIYTILVGLICLIIMMYIFDIQVSEMKYSTSTKKYVLNEDNYQKYKEYLMTLFFDYLKENKEQIKEGDTNKFFYNSTGNIVNYGTSNVVYSNKTEEFIFKTPDETRLTRNDYYKLEVVGESFKLIFVKTDYTYSI